jgi:WD40 repeat protein
VDFDPSRPRVVLSGSDALAEVWDVESRQRLAVLAKPPGGVNDLAFSPDGSRIATASVDGLVPLFDADTGALRLSLRVRMRRKGRGFQSERGEARLHELVRRCPDLGSRHRRSPRDRAARGGEIAHRRGVPPVPPRGRVLSGVRDSSS